MLVLAMSILASCKKASNPLDDARANDPFVFRSVLDSIPRIVTLALHDNLWVAYHADDCSMYKAWRDGVDLTGAVYDTQHGPQPMSKGRAWMQNATRQPWWIEQDGKRSAPAKVQYRGHRIVEHHGMLVYELTLADGKVIEVTEQPEFMENEQGLLGLERTFSTKNVPSGIAIGLAINVSSIATEQSLETDGGWKVDKSEPVNQGNISALSLSGNLKLKNNGTTRFATWLTKMPMVENPNMLNAAEGETEASPGMVLVGKSDCKTCHNQDARTVGPSYREIAAKYPNTPDNITTLTNKVINGGSGIWGAAAMTAHPNLKEADVRTMVTYIMDLDAKDEKKNEGTSTKLTAADPAKLREAATDVATDQVMPGVWVKIWTSTKDIETLSMMPVKGKPVFEGTVPAIVAQGSDFGELTDDFAMIATGYINIEKDNNFLFRLNSDDGSRFSIDNQVLITNDSLHGDSDPADGEIALKKGLHPFKLEYFQCHGGRGITLRWKSFSDEDFSIVPASAFVHKASDITSQQGATLALGAKNLIPGDGADEADVHPSYDRTQARPSTFMPKVGGMDFTPDGQLIVSTWDPSGSVYALDNVQSGDEKKIKVKQIAKGLAEPLGVKCVGKDIYVLQKQELTKLSDLDGDGIMDEYRTVCNGWRVSANFHEFAFGLAYKDGFLYCTLATAILPGGASAKPQIQDRGKVLKINLKDGSIEYMASGLRTPNGIGVGVDGELFVADNQGDWLPSSKIVHVKQGAFYGSYSVDEKSKLPVQQPVVWLPQDEIGNSPSQPTYINDGPYKGQMLHGEVTHGGLKRVFVEKVNGDYQGCVFRFTQGLEAGINRVVWGPDGALYVGGVGNPGNWSHTGGLWYGLQRLKFNKKSTFEMLAVRAKTNGVEIEFTEPLEPGDGWNTEDYRIKQWFYKPTAEYGGPKMDERALKVKSATVSQDRKRVFLELDGMKAGHVVYVRLLNRFVSELQHELWATEAWYTLNNIPTGQMGQVTRPTTGEVGGLNMLSVAEQKAGWKLLFDGLSTKGWHQYGNKPVGGAWKIKDGALVLDFTKKEGFQTVGGGDIVTDGEYENYELRLEWRIAPCGNSGIIYNVSEDTSKYQYCWQTGTEMQVLDNSCHPDAQIIKHRAGDLYDLISCRVETVKPAGEWNRVRIVVKKGHLEHWLNGTKVVETTMWDNTWKGLIAGSKFKDMKGFGTIKKGKIALQDHGDVVMYRNIKLKEL